MSDTESHNAAGDGDGDNNDGINWKTIVVILARIIDVTRCCWYY